MTQPPSQVTQLDPTSATQLDLATTLSQDVTAVGQQMALDEREMKRAKKIFKKKLKGKSDHSKAKKNRGKKF